MIRYIPIDAADFARPDEPIIRESVPLGVRRGDRTKPIAIRANRERLQRRERGSVAFSAVYSGDWHWGQFWDHCSTRLPVFRLGFHCCHSLALGYGSLLFMRSLDCFADGSNINRNPLYELTVGFTIQWDHSFLWERSRSYAHTH